MSKFALCALRCVPPQVNPLYCVEQERPRRLAAGLCERSFEGSESAIEKYLLFVSNESVKLCGDCGSEEKRRKTLLREPKFGLGYVQLLGP
jgi:hypothetical protein